MKQMKTAVFALSILIILLLYGCAEEKDAFAVINTPFGEIKVELFDSTAKHQENFIKLAEEGYFDSLLFHRVIKGFMIQGGDPDSRNAAPDKMLGMGGPGYTVDEEIRYPHVRGAVSAARMPDEVNPQKASSGSQFFIVQGYRVSEQELDQWEQRRGQEYDAETRELYTTEGGYPALDGGYTVFGKVVNGIEIVDKIANAATGANDRPVEDIPMEVKIVYE